MKNYKFLIVISLLMLASLYALYSKKLATPKSTASHITSIDDMPDREILKELLIHSRSSINSTPIEVHKTAIDGISDHDILKELTIIIPSIDKYSELWDPTVKLLLKNWSNLSTKHDFIPIYLVSNFETYHHPRIQNITIGKDISWSDNLLKVLEMVKTKYVIIFIEDYILTQPVNDSRLVEMIKLLKKTNGAYVEIALDGSL